MCLLAIASLAQEKADIMVSYTYEFPNYKTGERSSHNQYILLANTKESKFYSPRTEQIDSMKSTPEGVANYNEMTRNAYFGGKMKDIPRADGSFYVTKSFLEGKLRHYESVSQDKLMSEETLSPVDWVIGDSTKMILGYECSYASAKLNGREWDVWFATDIAIQDGPWKLRGLPGLILEAETNDGMYHFIATGVQSTNQPVGSIYLADQYEKVNRKDLWKAKRAFFDNPLGAINSRYGGGSITKVTDANGNDITNQRIYLSREEIDFIETDY